MKTRLQKRAAGLLLLCAFPYFLTGCDNLNYREAVHLYNNQSYDAAADIFYSLGDYEDSAALHTRSQYWAAVDLMEQGEYGLALPRFLKLSGYEDAADRAVECKYQLGIAAFAEGNLDDAECDFRENPDYRQTREYLRQIAWQRLFDAVAAFGTESDGSYLLQTEQDGMTCTVTADPAEPARLIFGISHTKDMGYCFYDDLHLILTRDQTQAAFMGTNTFSMDFGDSQIGSRQEISGTVDITACTAETVLIPEAYEKTVTDNQGGIISSVDLADGQMEDILAENLAALLEAVPELLRTYDIPQTLEDIGFAP